EGGCYLISGGAGGLARLFVQEMARRVQAATIILCGRSVLSEQQRAQLELAPSSGIHLDYQQADVSDGPAGHALIGRVQERYGRLDGIIHAAGVLRDSLLLNKRPEEVRAVLAPKVLGVEVLDEASREIPLDFFILCSSISAVMGNVGQADYAAANAYLDAFAHTRQAQVLEGSRQGTTVSINWPLWEEGGMQIGDEAIQMMRERLGAEVMGTETGMKTLYQALDWRQAQVIVLHGQVERIKQRWLHRSPKLPRGAIPVKSTTHLGHEGQQEQVGGDMPLEVVPRDALCKTLTQRVSRLLKVQVEEIDAATDLSEYGFDSITFTELANSLNQTYHLDLTPPLLFEHSSIERLALYLQTTYSAVLAPHFAEAPHPVAQVTQAMALVASEELAPVIPLLRQRSRLARSIVHKQEVPVAASPIAIIGMSGCFPQAWDGESLWSNLLEGKDCISEIPASRWDWQTYFGDPTTEENKTNIKWAGIVEGIETFDPLFFGISPHEAEQMDPQQRLLMMYVWKAIEDAGYDASSLSGTNTALFVGTASSGYSEMLSRAGRVIEGSSSTSQVPSVGPSRMSYFLNLHGPSEPIETACSSSLVAIHRGVNAIESGESALAIVGGVNILVSPEQHISFSKAGMLCEDGRCKAFGASANGYVRGEGVGMLVLKRLDLAEQDGDHIYGVILGSAENHGGRASSLTAPNPRAQADLLIAAYRKAGIDPRTVSYIEAHGTGTPLGDPIEINGLKTAWSELAQTVGMGPIQEAVCGIGSIKSNIGHLELAAGVAGVIKVLLQMQHKMLVKSLHCEPINPYIQLEGSPFYIVQESQEWETLRDHTGKALPRRAGVSSFGFGGVNAHVVLEEYVPKTQAERSGSEALPGVLGPTQRLLVLSARNEEQLQEQVRQLLAWVRTQMQAQGPLGSAGSEIVSDQRLQDLTYTLQVGREAMEERLAMLVSGFSELEEKLSRFLQEPQEGGDWYRGQVSRHKETLSLFRADEELQEAIDKWLKRGKYEKLLQGWVKGLTIDWKQLYRE
ncbi:MAG: SDR family NAD(P)-dependent oxidoreductase, partial [Chloroflexi bacterium]